MTTMYVIPAAPPAAVAGTNHNFAYGTLAKASPRHPGPTDVKAGTAGLLRAVVVGETLNVMNAWHAFLDFIYPDDVVLVPLVDWQKLTRDSVTVVSPKSDRFPHKCPFCGADAYIGLRVECSKACRYETR